MPKKYEHILSCHLSKRQRLLYDEFMSRTKTKETLATGNYMSIINILMQLRKVCNHPNLFAEPDIGSPFVLPPLQLCLPPIIVREFEEDPFFNARAPASISPNGVNILFLNLCLLHAEINDVTTVPRSSFDGIGRRIQELPLPVGFEQIRFNPISPRFGLNFLSKFIFLYLIFSYNIGHTSCLTLSMIVAAVISTKNWFPSRRSMSKDYTLSQFMDISFEGL